MEAVYCLFADRDMACYGSVDGQALYTLEEIYHLVEREDYASFTAVAIADGTRLQMNSDFARSYPARGCCVAVGWPKLTRCTKHDAKRRRLHSYALSLETNPRRLPLGEAPQYCVGTAGVR